jgi:hypothetical protein
VNAAVKAHVQVHDQAGNDKSPRQHRSLHERDQPRWTNVFKYIMMEVASNPSPEAKARDIQQTLLMINLLKKIKEVKNNVKVFKLHMHAQITKLTSYTTKAKEDLDADIMATYRSIPCSTF